MKKRCLIICLFHVSVMVSAKNGNRTPGGTVSPVDGKMSFSNQPFTGANTNTTTSFSSAEYIYGRIEVSSGTIKEVFKIKEDEKTRPFLISEITVLKNGDVINSGYSKDYFLVKDEFKNSDHLNFDVLPDPSKATTLYSMLNDFSAGLGFNQLTSRVSNARLPDGDYVVHFKIFTETYNVYGSLQSQDKWPVLEGEFNFKFREDDAERILKNQELISKTTIENAFRYDKLPDVFYNPGKLTDPAATSAKIAAILKRDLPQRQILKWVAETYNGPYWYIATDDFGLPKYKYFNPHIWMAYKKDGKCYVGSLTLRQVYTGGGTYGTLQVAFTSASSVPDKGIDCDKIK